MKREYKSVQGFTVHDDTIYVKVPAPDWHVIGAYSMSFYPSYPT